MKKVIQSRIRSNTSVPQRERLVNSVATRESGQITRFWPYNTSTWAGNKVDFFSFFVITKKNVNLLISDLCNLEVLRIGDDCIYFMIVARLEEM
jgi:hypothetical protein